MLPLCYEKKNGIYLEKKTENNKKLQTTTRLKKRQNRTWKARYRYLHIKIKVIFNKFKSIFKNTDNLQVG